MAGPLYFSAVEWLKKRQFEVLVPEFYHPFMPPEMKEAKLKPLPPINRFKMVPTKHRNPEPFRRVIDPNRRQRANYSCEVMLDMFAKQIEFEMAFEEDVVEILDNLDRYLLSLQPDVEIGLEKQTNYAKLVVKWRTEVYKHYYRYMMTHPAAKEKLYPNNDEKKNLVYLMSGFGIGEETKNLDPLRAKANPPYNIEESKPKEKSDTDERDYGLSQSLGISPATQLLSDDGRDFDYSNFLKKG